MEYAALKLLHVACVAISYTLFCVRGVWMMVDSPRLRARWVRVTPHVVDTLLLAAAIGLAISIRQYPGSHAWLTAKVVALFVYIALGTIALKRGRTLRIRTAAWGASHAVFWYLVAVALTRNALPWVS